MTAICVQCKQMMSIASGLQAAIS